MQFQATTPLGQALAAIIAILIAALAEHAAEHPVLAPGLRATIRQLEKIAARFDALVARHHANTLRPRTRAPLLRSRRESQQASWERKILLFVNKKKQKNFIHWRIAKLGRHRANGQTFFGSFFQKRTSFFLLLPRAPSRPGALGAYPIRSASSPGAARCPTPAGRTRH